MTILRDWTDEQGLHCLIIKTAMGHLCGYVGIPKSHELHGKGYSSALCGHSGCYEHTVGARIDVHGGITFEGNDIAGMNEELWYLGFDCAHAGDLTPGLFRHPGDVYRDETYVAAEINKLAQQLMDFTAIIS